MPGRACPLGGIARGLKRRLVDHRGAGDRVLGHTGVQVPAGLGDIEERVEVSRAREDGHDVKRRPGIEAEGPGVALLEGRLDRLHQGDVFVGHASCVGGVRLGRLLHE